MPLAWKEPSRDHRIFAAEVKGGIDRSTFVDAFADAWLFLFTSVVPLNKKEDWDHIQFEFWLDSGRCEVFVAHSDSAERVDRATCRLVSHALMSIWERCASVYAHSDELFIQAIMEEEKKIMAFAVEAANAVAREHAALRGVEVEFWNADSEYLDSFIIG